LAPRDLHSFPTRRSSDLIAELPAGQPEADLRLLLRDYPAVSQLIEAIAANSPFLWDLVRACPQRLVSFLTTDPEQAFERILLQRSEEHTSELQSQSNLVC